jgi:PGM1 C-terminal domain
VIPSIDLDQAVLDRHARELAALEERSLYLLFALRRAGVRLVVVTSLPVQAEVLEYYLRLIPDADEPRARIELLSPDDDSPRPLARKILERSDLLARLAELVPHSDRAFILPFNVRGCERDLALALDLPIYGIDHRFARYGTKTGARRLFESAGVSHPAGVDGLHGGAEVADAVISLRHTQPGLEGAVVKHDDAVSGDGNRIIPLRDLPPSGTAEEVAALDVRLRSLSQSYREKLGDGGIVEELIVGETRSPSVQLRIPPGGDPLVISTHDQVLGGELNQTFVACRFPARPDYAGRIVSEAQKAGEYLAAEGVAGRIGLDFVVVRRDGTWAPYAVEINLHEGGTAHPYETLWLLTDGSLDEAKTTFRAASGQAKHYFATDRLSHHGCHRTALRDFLAAATASGLDWDAKSQTGAVFHLLCLLEVEGRIGVTAIGDSPEQAHELYLCVARLLDRLAAGTAVAPTCDVDASVRGDEARREMVFGRAPG